MNTQMHRIRLRRGHTRHSIRAPLLARHRDVAITSHTDPQDLQAGETDAQALLGNRAAEKYVIEDDPDAVAGHSRDSGHPACLGPPKLRTDLYGAAGTDPDDPGGLVSAGWECLDEDVDAPPEPDPR